MKNNNIFKLFMYYANQNNIQNSGIYRYTFEVQENQISFVEIYNDIINIFLPDRRLSTLNDTLKLNIEAIFIVKTTKNRYYLTLFLRNIKKNQIIEFNKWFYHKNIKKIIYIEDYQNTIKYCGKNDLTFPKIDQSLVQNFNDNRPRYSYWNWIYNILEHEIEAYIFLDNGPLAYYINEKSIYINRQFLFYIF